jgi:hypothetical protein
MHVGRSWKAAHKGATRKQREALLDALFSGAGKQSMQQITPLFVSGTFVDCFPTASHMPLMHMIFICLVSCPQCA